MSRIIKCHFLNVALIAFLEYICIYISIFYESVGHKEGFLALIAYANRRFGQPSLEILRCCMSLDYRMIDQYNVMIHKVISKHNIYEGTL